MQTILGKKVFLIETLSADASFVLQHVQQKSIITQRDYNNLNHSIHTNEKIIIGLLDMLIGKGEPKCQDFLELLKQEQLLETFPKLKSLSTPSAFEDFPAKASSEIVEYKMSSLPRGLCLIINNEKFAPPHSERRGTDKDEESLKDVFSWLGFTVKVKKDQTATQMKALLKEFSKMNHDGDCFVCCILSHGSSDGVNGIDGGIISSEEIFGPFRGNSCPSLANKPKVFFIQACRGKEYQPGVKIQTDSLKAEEMEEEAGMEMDIVQVISLPADGDFLVARSTVKGYFSVRVTHSGTWFIQSLCRQLKHLCPKGEDVQSILICVNEEVGGKEVRVGYNKTAIQMPVQKVTLRKKLVFHVPNASTGPS